MTQAKTISNITQYIYASIWIWNLLVCYYPLVLPRDLAYPTNWAATKWHFSTKERLCILKEIKWMPRLYYYLYYYEKKFISVILFGNKTTNDRKYCIFLLKYMLSYCDNYFTYGIQCVRKRSLIPSDAPDAGSFQCFPFSLLALIKVCLLVTGGKKVLSVIDLRLCIS